MKSFLDWLLRKYDKTNCLFGNVAISLFVLAQILDGVSTYIGVNTGLTREVNPLILWLISVMGLGPALITAKLVGIIIGFWAYLNKAHNFIIASAIFYFVFVLFIPWSLTFLVFLISSHLVG